METKKKEAFKLRTPQSSKVDKTQTIPWIEKYRPKSVDEVAHQDEVVQTLKKSLETKNLPHLLFYGPPGTGKTSTILAIGRQLYGPELFKERVLELNASDERGINVIRTKVKTFSQITASNAPAGSSVPPYKLLILDEADAMTADAQAALRRTMESCSKTTRFCLICNYVSRIIEPLASRCAKFRFKPLHYDVMKDRIRYICDQERVPFTNDLARTLADVSEGDLRKAINYLQNTFRLYEDKITPLAITEVAGSIPPNALDDLIKVARSGSFDQVQRAVKEVVYAGYPAAQIFTNTFDRIVTTKDLTDLQKSNIAEQLAIAEKCLIDGADESLQLMSVFAFIMKEFQNRG